MHAPVRAVGVDIRLDRIHHRPAGSAAVEPVLLDIVALPGTGGCGKTTLPRIAAGLRRQSSAAVRIGSDAVDALRTAGLATSAR
jgi:ABC-type sulfate/molybdate transport systems ATPase subunit